MKLYRATNRKSDAKKIPHGSCWAKIIDDARKYLDNPGHGGKYLVEVEVAPKNVLDLSDGPDNDNWGALRDILQPEMSVRDFREWLVAANTVNFEITWMEQVIDCPKMRTLLMAEGYEWVTYYDTYPYGCETWVRL